MVVHFTLNSSNLSKKYKVAMTSENMLYHLTLLMFQPEFDFFFDTRGRDVGRSKILGGNTWWTMSPVPPLPSFTGPIRKLLIKVLSASFEIERIVSRLQDLNVFFVI